MKLERYLWRGKVCDHDIEMAPLKTLGMYSYFKGTRY